MQDTPSLDIAAGAGHKFVIGPPHDSVEFLQLFSFVLKKADEAGKSGKEFEVPFAALLKLASQNHPTLDELAGYQKSHAGKSEWPAVLRALPANDPQGMFFDLLGLALDSAEQCHLRGPQVCRLLAAVGQTLRARNRRFSQSNRRLAEKHSYIVPPSRKSETPEATQKQTQLLIKNDPPWQADFRRYQEEAACLRLDKLVLWHASYIGPRFAEKAENQDATFAMTTPGMSSPPSAAFALADGVTTSWGSRLAATSIVRRFCESLLQRVGKDRKATADDLIESAKRTQASLDELTASLLLPANLYVFEATSGSSLKPKSAARVLENTLTPRVASMPSALSSTLIGGVVQPCDDGTYQVELLRIGDGSVEHINTAGHATAVLDTDSDVMTISEALGPGPRSRALFEEPGRPFTTRSITLARGESLLVSSDGLARGHKRLIAEKVSELLGEQFWITASPEQVDAALKVLHKACASADNSFAQGAGNQELFADNVSLIMIRAGG